MAAVVYVSSDLMFYSRLLGAAETLGVSLQMAAQPAGLIDKLTLETRLVLVDLGLPALDTPALDLQALVAAVRQQAPAAQLLAFGAHVNEAALAAAAAAGFDSVLTRGQFQKHYLDLLRPLRAAPDVPSNPP